MDSNFICPSDSSHTFPNYEDFRQHLVKCRQLQDRTGYICRYFFGHMFLNTETRDIHERHCPVKGMDYPRTFSVNSLRLGTNYRSNILGPKFDEAAIFGTTARSTNSSNVIPNNVIQQVVPNEININNNMSMSFQNGANNKNMTQSFGNTVAPQQINNRDNNKTQSNNDMINMQQQQQQPRLKAERILISERVGEGVIATKTAVQPNFSKKLEGLIHTLVLDQGQRMEIILRRRSNNWRLKMKEFSINEFHQIKSFGHLLNEKLTQYDFENEYFVGEFTLFGVQHAELYKTFLSRFESGIYVGLNTLYKDSQNEVLLLCTKNTNLLGNFLKKGDISILLFKYTQLFNKVRLVQSDLRSPWVDPIQNELDDQDDMPIEVIKQERMTPLDMLEFKKETLDKKSKNPYHFYTLTETQLNKEDERKEESVLDLEIEDLDRKTTELRNLITRQTEKYKFSLNELESLNQRRKIEIKEQLQMLNLIEKKRLELKNDYNHEELLYIEDKKQFQYKFDEELRKQKEKYHQVYEQRLFQYDKELGEKLRELPGREKEVSDLEKDLELKRSITEQEMRSFTEEKAKLTELKKAFDNLTSKQNFLEMHKKLNRQGLLKETGMNQDRCNYCLTTRRNVLYLPCRHLVACEACVRRVREQGVECCLSCKKEVKQLKIVKWD